MKYDSSTGKLYEELGCPNNNNTNTTAAVTGAGASAGAGGVSSAMDTSQNSVPSTTTPTASGMTQSQQMHTDYYHNYQHAYPYSSQVRAIRIACINLFVTES